MVLEFGRKESVCRERKESEMMGFEALKPGEGSENAQVLLTKGILYIYHLDSNIYFSIIRRCLKANF